MIKTKCWSYGNDHSKLALCYNNIALAYQREMKYSEALDYHQKTLIIRQKHFPADYPHLGLTYTNIANADQDLGNLNCTLEHSNFALSIYKKIASFETSSNCMDSWLYRSNLWKDGTFLTRTIAFWKSSTIFRQTLYHQHIITLIVFSSIFNVIHLNSNNTIYLILTSYIHRWY